VDTSGIVTGVTPLYALSKYTFAPDGSELTEIVPVVGVAFGTNVADTAAV